MLKRFDIDSYKEFICKYIVDEGIKKERSRKLIEVSNELEKEYNQSFIGKEKELLVEEYVEGYSIGHTSNFLRLKIDKELKINENYNIIISEDMF